MHGRSAPRGFTLLELLIVIAIISALASMVLGVSVWARKKAMLTKCRTNISSIVTALEAYNTQNGMYPNGQLVGKSRDDPEALFRGLCTGQPKYGGSRDNHLDNWPMEQIGKWTGGFQDSYQTPSEADLDFTTGIRVKCVLLDPWGHAYHYAEFDSRAQTDRVAGNFRAKGHQPFAIWSDGPDLKNDWGLNDDVTSWSDAVTGGTQGRPK